MNQQKNENRNPQDGKNSNPRTNQERGRNDLNPTDRGERKTDREFDLDEEKESKLKVSSKTIDPSKNKDLEKQNENKSLPRHEDPNVNAENENHREKTGTMRNLPKNQVPAEE